MGLNGVDCIRRIEVLKSNNVKIHWDWMMQIGKPVKFQCVCHMKLLIKSKKEYWIKFRFGYFIIHFKSRLLTPMQLPTSNFIRGKKT